MARPIIQSSIQGARRLDSAFNRMPKTFRSKIQRKALKAGLKPIVKQARMNVENVTINLRGRAFPLGSIIKKGLGSAVRRGSGGNLYGVAGMRYKDKREAALSFWLEFGTLAFRTEPLRSKRRPKAKAAAEAGYGLRKRPFLRPAARQAGNASGNAYMEKALTEITKEILKA